MQTKQIWCNATANVWKKRLIPRIEKELKEERVDFLLDDMIIERKAQAHSIILSVTKASYDLNNYATVYIMNSS